MDFQTRIIQQLAKQIDYLCELTCKKYERDRLTNCELHDAYSLGIQDIKKCMILLTKHIEGVAMLGVNPD